LSCSRHLTLPLRGEFTLPNMENSEAHIRVELLYFDGCPSYEHVRSDLAKVIAEISLDVRVRLIIVDTQVQADALCFAGSPTVKVNGRDLEDYDGPGILGCRLYSESGKGWPTRKLLKNRLLAALPSAAQQLKLTQIYGGNKG
jgi:hypothetical protein